MTSSWPRGRRTLAELFAGRSQLVVYHFMYGPDWKQGCHRCSFWADNVDGIDLHLAARDTTFVAASNTALANIERYRDRMGWRFAWVSTLGTEFNRDFHVSFAAAELARGDAYYNYRNVSPHFPGDAGAERLRAARHGRVAHAYSTYGRGSTSSTDPRPHAEGTTRARRSTRCSG